MAEVILQPISLNTHLGYNDRRTDPVEERLREAEAKIGDLTLRLEIAETYLRKKGVRLWRE